MRNLLTPTTHSSPGVAGEGCELACAPESEARVFAAVSDAAAALPEHRVLCLVTVACGAAPPGAPFAAAEQAAPRIAQRLRHGRFERWAPFLSLCCFLVTLHRHCCQ